MVAAEVVLVVVVVVVVLLGILMVLVFVVMVMMVEVFAGYELFEGLEDGGGAMTLLPGDGVLSKAQPAS